MLLSVFYVYGSKLKSFYSYRVITVQDIPDLIQSLSHFFTAENVLFKWEEIFESLLIDKHSKDFTHQYMCHICEFKNEMVGMILLQSENINKDENSISWELRLLAVHPNHRLKGIATSLLTRCINTATDFGSDQISIELYKSSPASDKLLQTFNFTASQSLGVKTINYPQLFILNLVEHSEEKNAPNF